MRPGRSDPSEPPSQRITRPCRLICVVAAAAIFQGAWTDAVHAVQPVPANIFKAFASLPDDNNCQVVPPDPDCAAGPDRLIGTVNSRVALWDKTGSKEVDIDLDKFFDELRDRDNIDWDRPPDDGILCPFIFDPRVLYDQYINRFIIITLAIKTDGQGVPQDSFLLMGVSTSPSPKDFDDPPPGNPQLRNWLKFSFKIDTDTNWADYPTIGVDEDTIYVNYNMFPKQAGGVFARMHQIDKGPLLDPINPPPTLANRFFDNITNVNLDPAFTIQPAHSFGVTQTEWFVNVNPDFAEQDQIFLYGRDGGGSPTNFQKFAVRVPPFTIPANLGRQPSGAPQIDTVSDRFNNSAVWRDNSLWCAHTIKGPNGAVVRWYEFDTFELPFPPTLVQSGDITQGPPAVTTAVDNFMPAIMVNPAGDMLVSYTCTGPTLEPSICFSHRFSTDVPGTTQPPTLVKAGNDYVGFGTFAERWGDYSGIALDPDDPSTIWILHEVGDDSTGGKTGDWETWFASVTLVGSGGGPPGPPVPTDLSITRPNQIENFVNNTIEPITWTASGPPEALVRLELFLSGHAVGVIANDVLASAAPYNWIVGRLLPDANGLRPVVAPSNLYQVGVVAVKDADVFDLSDNFFRITQEVQIDAGVFDTAGALQTEAEFVPGESVQLNAMATEGLAPYFFKWTPQSFLDNPNIANPVALPLRDVTYAVTVRDSTGNEASTMVTLTAGNPLRIDAGTSQLFSPGGEVILEGSVVGGTPPYTIEWFDCDPAACANPAVADTIQPFVSPAAATIFFLRVTDAAGEVLMDNVLVEPGFNVHLENDPGNGGTISRSPIQSLYRFTDQVTYTASPNPGFIFDHWDGDASGTANPVTIAFPNDNLTIRAVYGVDTSAATPDGTGPSPPLPVPTGNCGPGMAGGFMVAGLCLLFIRQRRRLRR